MAEPIYSVLVAVLAALVAAGVVRVASGLGAAGVVGLVASWGVAASWGVLEVVRDGADPVTAGSVAPVVVAAVAVLVALGAVLLDGRAQGYALLGGASLLSGWAAARVAAAVGEPTLTRMPDWADHGSTAAALGAGGVVLGWCVLSDVLIEADPGSRPPT